MQLNDLNWLAGYLEGEGCFRINLHHDRKKPNYVGTPTITVQAVDEDVINKAALLMGCEPRKCNQPTCTGKTVWAASVFGEKAIVLMEELLPLMGRRRSQKIKEVIEIAKNRPGLAYGERCVQSKLTWSIVKEIREKAKNPYFGMQSQLARLYDVSQAAIFSVIKNRTWRESPPAKG